MEIMIAVLGAILAIFVVIIIHEFGHFIVARMMGVRVLRFSIGFGRAIWSKTTKKGTEFVIAWLPFGGYIRMLGEGDEATPGDLQQYSYNNKSVYRRMAIIIAGPLMNFILAVILYWILFLPGVVNIKPIIGHVAPNSIAAKAGLRRLDHIIAVDNKPVKNWRAVIVAMIEKMGEKGNLVLTISHPPALFVTKVKLPLSEWQLDERQPDFLKALGITPYLPKLPMIVGPIVSGSPAEQGGLQEGDRVISVNGKRYYDMVELVHYIRQHPGKRVDFQIKRNGKTKQIQVTIGRIKDNHHEQGFLGFQMVATTWPASMIQKENYTIFSAWRPALLQTWGMIKLNGIVLGKMIAGKISLKSLGGPITIFQMAGKASQQNYRIYLTFLAFFSVALGFINLLPIPGLDGGHFLFQVIEVVFRRPVPLNIQMMCLRIGFLLLILLILYVTFNDLSRILGLGGHSL